MPGLRPTFHSRKTSDASQTTENEPSPTPGSSSSIADDASASNLQLSLRPKARRRLSSVWSKRSRSASAGGEEAGKGPLGLRLLHSSPEPLIDLVFVHGLRGGSVKTWRKGDDPELFWPQCWLPLDPGFQNANIYSFGYDSDWGTAKASILNVHDFGRALFEEMRTSPHLRTNLRGPIILIGHSMGGLVVKKAVVLAHQDTQTDFAARIRSIFFLATPHRGSDYAATLNNILKVSGLMSSREYISDLTIGSTSAQLINDDFGQYAHSLAIFSFYETLRMNLGVSSSLIVEKNSAILGSGFRNERVQYLNANHRDICKFESPEDPNYVTLRNALASNVQDLLENVFIARKSQVASEVKALGSFLGVFEKPDDNHPRIEGSCQWFEDRDDFQEWRDMPMDLSELFKHAPAIYWISANPGTGKTVLAAHVISELLELQLQCSYYFFHHGNKSHQTLSGMLRSLAYQMALSNQAIRGALTECMEEGIAFDKDDARAIWTRLYKNVILQAPIATPQYWVIDALDECLKHQELFTFLKGETSSFPLRILITSRKDLGVQRSIRPMLAHVTAVEIPVSDTMKDIECLIRQRAESLPIDEDSERDALAKKILDKSQANFLWVRLVMDELEGVYGYESILQVLDSIPEGMVPYYQRSIDRMTQVKHEKALVKAILQWVVLAASPLSTAQLAQALKLDINVHVPSVKSAVEGLCGNLLSVDEHDKVQIVHTTAQEFLLSEEAGEFRISKSAGNERISLACLAVLSSTELQPPRHWRLLGQKNKTPLSPLLDYAITRYSDHIYGASSESDKLLAALDRFLRANALSWIEKVAAMDDLHCLMRTAKNFRSYLDRRAKYRSPLNKQVHHIEAWCTDLARLVPKFGSALIAAPTSIHFLIPPLCPTTSTIFQACRSQDGLTLAGANNSTWDDCIANVSFGHEVACAIACGHSCVAVGMASGLIQTYSYQSFQKQHAMKHKQAVDKLFYHPSGKSLLSSSVKFLSLWAENGTQLWQTRLKRRCIAFAFSESDSIIFAVTQHGHVFHFNLSTGELVEDQVLAAAPPAFSQPTGTDWSTSAHRAPAIAAFSPDLEIIALGYRSGPIGLWTLRDGSFLAWAEDLQNRLPLYMEFNPHPELSMLLVAYDDSHLAAFDAWSGASVASNEHELGTVAFSALACSSDARTAATTSLIGELHIWDFESLTLLYRVSLPTRGFKLLRFTGDAASLVELSATDMRVWAPAALVRKMIEEDMSASDDAQVIPAAMGQYETDTSSKISCLVAHPTLPFFLAGRYDGSVVSFDAKSGAQNELYGHPGSALVMSLAISDSGLVASSDVNGLVQVWALKPGSPTSLGLAVTSMQFQRETMKAVRQLLFSADGTYLLISTTDQAIVLKRGVLVGAMDRDPQARESERFLCSNVFTNGGEYEFILVSGQKIERHSIEKFPSRSSEQEIGLPSSVSEPSSSHDEQIPSIPSAMIHRESKTLTLTTRFTTGFKTSLETFVFDLGSNAAPPGGIVTTKQLQGSLEASKKIRCLVTVPGADKNRIRFLGTDSWISSVDVSGGSMDKQMRHFFVPQEFLRAVAADDIAPVATPGGQVAFAVHGSLAIIQGGLKFQQPIS